MTEFLYSEPCKNNNSPLTAYSSYLQVPVNLGRLPAECYAPKQSGAPTKS